MNRPTLRSSFATIDGLGHPARERVAPVHQEFDQQSRQGTNAAQISVKFWRCVRQFRQTIPRHGRQIVVFVMISDIQRQHIDRPVITARFLFRVQGVVLLNPARAERVQSYREPERS